MIRKVLIISMTLAFWACSTTPKVSFQEKYISEYMFSYLEPVKWLKETSNSMPNSLIINYMKRGPNSREMSIALHKNKQRDLSKTSVQNTFKKQFLNLNIVSDSLITDKEGKKVYKINGIIEKGNVGKLYVTAIMASEKNMEYNIVFSNLNSPVSKVTSLIKLMNALEFGVKKEENISN